MKHFLIVILLQICCYSCAQVEISTKQLIGTKWILPSVPNSQSHMQFYSDYFMHTWDIEYDVNNKAEGTFWSKNNVEHKKRHRENKYYYYLSKEEPAYFNQKMTGKKSKGMYLVCYNTEVQKIDCYKIISFSKEKIVMYKKAKDLKEGEISIGGPIKDVTLVLERVYE